MRLLRTDRFVVFRLFIHTLPISPSYKYEFDRNQRGFIFILLDVWRSSLLLLSIKQSLIYLVRDVTIKVLCLQKFLIAKLKIISKSIIVDRLFADNDVTNFMFYVLTCASLQLRNCSTVAT